MTTTLEQLDLQQQTAARPSLAHQDVRKYRTPAGGRLRWVAVLVVAWALSGVYAGSYLMRGWVPHDEGAFAQSAERVLHGQMPHRDYTEIYTGGLAYVHAFAFKHLGENLGTLRIVLFGFVLVWVPVLYWIGSRFVRDWIAGGMTLLAIAWSIPNYSAAVPSWYNLFFATFGLAALLAFMEKRAARWLFVAGMCGGLSFLAKSTALFYAAAIFLFFLFEEQSASSRPAGSPGHRSVAYSAFVVLITILMTMGVALFVGPRGGLERSLNFVVPTAALALVILLRESRMKASSSGTRLLALSRMCIPFGLGFALPVLLFLIPYIYAGALRAFYQGVFVLPFKRVASAVADPPDLVTVIPCVFIVAMVGCTVLLRGAAKWILVAGAAIGGAYYLVSSGQNFMNYRAAWHGAYWLTPFVCAGGAILLLKKSRDSLTVGDSLQQQRLFLLLAICALCSLIQYPFSAPIYFCYVAPFAVLAAAGVVTFIPAVSKAMLAVVYAWFLLFAVFRVNPPFINAMGFYYQPNPATEPLRLSRAAHLTVDAESHDVYSTLIPLIQRHAGSGRIFAGPDTPEIYFLSGDANPTRALFDFFDYNDQDYQRVLRLVDTQHTSVVVINTRPPFSNPFAAGVFAELEDRYSHRLSIGHFIVFWGD